MNYTAMNIIERKPWIALLIVLAAFSLAGHYDYHDRLMGYEVREGV